MSHRFNSKRCDTSLYAPLPFLGSVPFTTLHSDGSTHCIHMKSAGNNFHPSQIPTVPPLTSVTMYNYHPRRLAKSNIEKQYFSHCVNDVCNGSPSRILRVRLISFGITILPRSSDCVNQVQKIFVKLQKALKYKDFQLSGAFTLVILIESF